MNAISRARVATIFFIMLFLYGCNCNQTGQKPQAQNPPLKKEPGVVDYIVGAPQIDQYKQAEETLTRVGQQAEENNSALE